MKSEGRNPKADPQSDSAARGNPKSEVRSPKSEVHDMTKTKQKPNESVRSPHLVLCDHASPRSPYCVDCRHGRPHNKHQLDDCGVKKVCKARYVTCSCKTQNKKGQR